MSGGGRRSATLLALVLFSFPFGKPSIAPALEEEKLGEFVSSVAPVFVVPGREAVGRDAVVEAVSAAAPEVLSRYIRIDTSNPPGNESDGARFLAALLEAEGIAPKVLESSPGRGNVVARLRGRGGAKPIILLSHIDVVSVEDGEWTQPPFLGRTVDGVLYGRGALDAKAVGVTHLLAMVAIKRAGIQLDRDIIFMATADEEAGGRNGAGWLIQKHLGLFADAEFVLNEGGWIIQEEGRPLIYSLDVAEKGPCWFRLVATGKPGHGSRPAADTAPTRLIRALHRLLEWERPYEVGPIVAGYYAAYAAFDQEHARQFRQLSRSLEDRDFHRWFTSDPVAAALIRDTLAPNVMSGSAKVNVVPSEASAEIDSRLLPGRECGRFLDAVRERVDDKEVRVEQVMSFPASESPLDNHLTRAIERLAGAESTPAVVLPTLLTGFTDSHYFREKGIASYGFVPIVVTPEEKATIHAPNERVRAAELSMGVVRMIGLLEEVAR